MLILHNANPIIIDNKTYPRSCPLVRDKRKRYVTKADIIQKSISVAKTEIKELIPAFRKALKTS